MNRLPSVSSYASVLGSSLRFVLNDNQLCGLAGVGRAWLAASLPTKLYQLLKLEIAVIPSKARNLKSFTGQ